MPNELPKAFRDGIPFEASAVKGFMSEEAGQESSAELLLFPDPTTLAFCPGGRPPDEWCAFFAIYATRTASPFWATVALCCGRRCAGWSGLI